MHRLKLPLLPGYDRLIKLGKERKNAVLLDIGCCCKSFRATSPVDGYIYQCLICLVGNDVRMAAADGFPVKQIEATDLYGGPCLVTWPLRVGFLATLTSRRRLLDAWP